MIIEIIHFSSYTWLTTSSKSETHKTGITSIININNDNRTELIVGCITHVYIKISANGKPAIYNKQV